MPERKLVGVVFFYQDWYEPWCLNCYIEYQNYARARVNVHGTSCFSLYEDQLEYFSQDCHYCGQMMREADSGVFLFDTRSFLECDDPDCDGNCDPPYDKYLTPDLFPESLMGGRVPRGVLPEIPNEQNS